MPSEVRHIDIELCIENIWHEADCFISKVTIRWLIAEAVSEYSQNLFAREPDLCEDFQDYLVDVFRMELHGDAKYEKQIPKKQTVAALTHVGNSKDAVLDCLPYELYR